MTALNHLYAYAGENPVNFVDPLGLHTVGFSGTGVLVVDDNGNPVAYYPATSGLPGYMDPMYQNLPDKGPIPAGRYYFNPNEMSRVEGFRQRLRDFFGLLDWGNVRVPLYPYPDTNTLRRRGFKIHGGKKPGSKGCIDIGQKDTDFYDLLHGHQGPIDVIVDYR